MEADIRTAQTELDDVGMMVENKRGTPIPNPLLSVIDTLERRQLAVIRSMSLNQTASNPRTLNGFAKLETKARSAIAKVGADDFIARPQYYLCRNSQSPCGSLYLLLGHIHITTLFLCNTGKPQCDPLHRVWRQC